MNGMSVATKLNAMVALLVLAMLSIAGIGLYALHDAQTAGGAASDAQREFAVAAAAAQAAEGALRAQAQSTGNSAALQVHAEIGGKRLEELKASMGRLGLDAATVTQAARLQAELAQQYGEVSAKPAPGKAAVAAPALDTPAKQAQLRSRLAEMRAGLQKATDGDAAQLAEAAQARSSSAAAVIAVIILLVTALGAYLRVTVRQGILRSIRAAAHVVSRVADGDLTAGVSVKAAGETQKLLEGLEKMTADLRKLVGAVAASAHTVADTSAQIAQGNLDLSQRTEEQASTLEETASSMEELTSTVAHNAENARQASQLAINASEVARKAGEVVDKVVDTMDGISDASKKIADIIGVIDGIAFQTNILALNAAVEAARAGEQGRGFAVVAAEVRNLAQRSAAAAKEIKMLIGESVLKVQAGGTLVDAAGHTMVEVVSSVQKVSDLIADIAAASQEQSSGIGQVNTAVTQMEQVVQQNATLVEQATAATEAMKEQAKVLLSIVARFNIGQKHGAFAPAQPVMPAPAVPPAIKVRPSAKLPPAYAALAAASPKPGRNGAWEEF